MIVAGHVGHHRPMHRLRRSVNLCHHHFQKRLAIVREWGNVSEFSDFFGVEAVHPIKDAIRSATPLWVRCDCGEKVSLVNLWQCSRGACCTIWMYYHGRFPFLDRDSSN